MRSAKKTTAKTAEKTTALKAAPAGKTVRPKATSPKTAAPWFLQECTRQEQKDRAAFKAAEETELRCAIDGDKAALSDAIAALEALRARASRAHAPMVALQLDELREWLGDVEAEAVQVEAA